jgi:signal transduction histidine kinase
MTLRRALWNLALAAAAFLLAWVPATLSIPSGALTDVIWPFAGYVLGSVLLWGPRAIPPLMAGEFLVSLAVGAPWWQSLWVATWEVALWGGASAWLMRRVGGYRAGLDSLGSVLGFFLIPLGGCMFLRVALGMYFRVAFGWTTWDHFGGDLLSIWLSVAAGILIVAPAMLAGVEHRGTLRSVRPARYGEAVLLWAGLLATAYVLVPAVRQAASLSVLPFLVFPFFIWAALRFGIFGVGMSSLVFGVASFERFFFSGSFPEAPVLREAMLFYQTLLIVASATGLLVAGALADRRRAVEGLEETVAGRTAELRTANDGKDRLLSIIGHDLRAPLYGLVRLSEYLMESAARITPDRLADYAGEMHQSAKGQIEALENLLSWARLRTGQVAYRPETLPVDALLGPVVNLFRLRANLRGITLSLLLPAESTPVSADPEMTRTIVRNLLSNALPACPEQGRVTVEARADGDDLVVAVNNDGPGLTEEEIRHHFDGEADSPRGLGLVLVREFCAVQDARLRVESALGRGTRVSFRLPLAQ